LKRALPILLVLEFAFRGIACAQVPTGTITGLIADPTGAAIPDASVVVTNKETGLKRALLASDAGDFSVSALLPGIYEVTADANGFKRLRREATVEAGSTTSVNLAMEVGPASEQLTVQSAVPQISYESTEISGIVTPPQIKSLPLNGRSYLELAKLEPGAQQPTRASNNRTLVPLLGAPAGQNGRATRVTVDGGSVMEIGNGGAAMGFSQEVVQEFQVATANFDLSTAATASGAVNVATRSGSNQLHGSGFIFFRDNHFSAYPGLSRDPSNPDPFFQRRQFGVALGGPIRRDRAFFFGTFERNEQRGVIATELVTPEFASLSRIVPSPTYVDQLTLRTDLQLSEREFLFVRYSHEGSFSFAPTTVNGVVTATYPSAWARQPAWADQSILGLTSQLSTAQVNDVRFSYFFVSAAQQGPLPSDCFQCLGLGAPSITVRPDLFIGTSTTDTVLGRRYQLTDLFTWQKGTHRLRFGGDWETARGGRTDIADQPVTMTLYSPSSVRAFNALQRPSLQIPLPATFLTLADILQLPLQNFTVGIGDPHVPQAGFGNARVATLVYLYAQDTWHLRPRFVVNYGLGWTYDAPLNYDLRKPDYLEPVLGASGLAATHKNWKDFSPSLGFAWNLRGDGKTVIRGGVGVYYDAQTPFGIADNERVSLGPRGVGRGSYFSGGIRDPVTGTLLNFSNPTTFTGASLLQILPVIRGDLAQLRGDPNNRDFSVTNIEVDKQGSVDATHLPSLSATHFSLGVQREIVRDLVVSADFVLRQFRHIGPPPGLLDANHFSSARGPVLPLCSDAQRTDPSALCSLGPIFVNSGIGGARYEGLLVRADKRLSRNVQLLASYAYSSNVGDNFSNGFNNDNPLDNKGPLDRDFRHILSVSGLTLLPERFQLGLVLTSVSKPPFSAFLGGLDLNGDGTTGDLLPGTTVNEFNRGLGKEDLRLLVNQFNTIYAGKRDAKGAVIRPIVLPSQFAFGDSFSTQDLRLSREFPIGDRWRLSLIGEAFNVFNIANLSGRSGNLLAPGFGQPTSRVTQVFGSGGPRSFQLAARASF
jgi:Carboxypeptidase regulatory-like domain